VKLWINDFDNNGLTEKLLTRTVNQKDMPVFLKREITDQIVSLKKQNLKYVDFATKSIQDLFSQDVLKNSTVKTFTYSSSIIALNEGNGKFKIVRLPDAVQFSCVNAILCTDMNGDGNVDLVMGGNNFGLQPQFSRLDASYGHVLINDGKGNFKEMPSSQTGLELRGEIRDIKLIEEKQKSYLLFLQNNEYPVMYRLNK
jgi:enediyne biosynthesis protein E4